MPRVSEAYREQRRREIAAAAVRCAERSGIGQVSMTDIITESGLSPGAVYGHFDTKEQVILYAGNEALAAHLARLGSLAHAIQTRNPSLEPMTPRRLLSAVLNTALTDPDDSTFSTHLMSQALVDPEIAAIAATMMKATQDLFASQIYASARTAGRTHDQATDAVRDLVPVLVTLVQGFLFRRNTDPTDDGQILAQRILAMIPDSY